MAILDYPPVASFFLLVSGEGYDPWVLILKPRCLPHPKEPSLKTSAHGRILELPFKLLEGMDDDGV